MSHVARVAYGSDDDIRFPFTPVSLDPRRTYFTLSLISYHCHSVGADRYMWKCLYTRRLSPGWHDWSIRQPSQRSLQQCLQRRQNIYQSATIGHHTPNAGLSFPAIWLQHSLKLLGNERLTPNIPDTIQQMVSRVHLELAVAGLDCSQGPSAVHIGTIENHRVGYFATPCRTNAVDAAYPAALASF